MADEKPAEELRAAAAVLREIAQALREQAKPPQQPLMWFAEDLIAGSTLTVGDADSADHKLTAAEARWLALASPMLAEPLAAILDNAADIYEGVLEELPEHYHRRMEPNARATVERELVLARLINDRAAANAYAVKVWGGR